MAKRFIDTGIMSKKWFRKLSNESKLFFIYLITNCDLVGVWDIDFEQVRFYCGRINEKKVMAELHGQVIRIDDDKLFIPDFVPFQYGETLNEKSPIHRKIIDLLNKYTLKGDTLYHTLSNRLNHTPKEEEEEKDKEEEEENTTYTRVGNVKKPSVEELAALVNSKLGKKCRVTDKVAAQWRARTKDGYTLEDVSLAVDNAMKNDFHRGKSYQHLTVEFFTRADKLDYWKNATPTQMPAPPKEDHTARINFFNTDRA